MSFSLSERSRHNLAGVHPHLIQVVTRALTLTTIDFTVIEGVRSLERQKQLVARGASKTLKSRHLTGHAVDVVPWVGGAPSWHWPDYHTLATFIKEAAEDLGIPIEWGGDWGRFPDGPHWQLPKDIYPAD